MAAVNQINQMLDDLILDPYRHEVGTVLRNSLLVSTVLSNIEAIYNLKERQIEQLENIDTILLRKILQADSKTSKPMLFLALGVVPL